MRIIILTSNELRHRYFRIRLASFNSFQVVASFCEKEENLLSVAAIENSNTYKQMHLAAREESERDFFLKYCDAVDDRSNSIVIERGTINNGSNFEKIVALAPDLIIVYGASIIKGALLQNFAGKILNVHLGLSPYYRGAATNFWPLVHKTPQCVGATFMYIDAGIDTGEIIHQIRARYNFYDTPATIGNRLIADVTDMFATIIEQFNYLQKTIVSNNSSLSIFCRKKDYTEDSVKVCYENFYKGMITDYLARKCEMDSLYPIIQNTGLIL